MIKVLRGKIISSLRKAFPDHEDVLTDGLGTLIVYFLYFSIAIMALPLLLTCKSISFIDFSQTGTIGDTIGGIMGPFVALLAAFLTFLAFWIQYRANNLQRDIAERQLNLSTQQNEMVAKQTELAEKQMEMAKEQEKKYAIERFENTLHQMLDVYSRNSEAVRVNGLTGKEAFEELAAELSYNYFLLDRILRQLALNRQFTFKDEEHRKMVNALVTNLFDDMQKRLSFLTTLSYDLFFYGTFVVDLDKAYHHQDELLLAYELLSLLTNMKYNENKSISYKSLLKKMITPTLEEISYEWYEAPYPIAKGHNAMLGHYYRQMLQIIKFVSDAPEKMINDRDKYEYAKMLRSQLCDAEQVLLYYNSLSIMGKTWNERHGEDINDIRTWGYIARYRLIKNIPSSYPFFGVIPTKYYKEFTDKWKEQFGEDFFESETFANCGNSD